MWNPIPKYTAVNTLLQNLDRLASSCSVNSKSTQNANYVNSDQIFLFCTSNLPSKIDPAFHSRIDLHLTPPMLSIDGVCHILKTGIIELGRIGVVGVKKGKLGRMQTVSVTVIVTVTRRPMRERLIAIYCSILLTKITNHRQRQDTQRRHPKGSQHPWGGQSSTAPGNLKENCVQWRTSL